VSRDWSGVFRLRAEGSFIVAADFAHGVARLVEVRSLRGGRCNIQNPWNETCIVRTDGRVVLRTNASTLQFETQPGSAYLIDPQSQPLSDYPPTPIKDAPNQHPGLPGRDTPSSL
jgi:hypothetical protein